MARFIIALLIAIIPVSRTERPSGVYVRYYVEAEQQPVVQAEHGSVVSYTATQDPATTIWRFTVGAKLDPCAGSLMIDGTMVTQQRCVRLPIVIQPSR